MTAALGGPDCLKCGAELTDDEEGNWHHASSPSSCDSPSPSPRWLARSVAAEARLGQVELLESRDEEMRPDEVRWLFANVLLSLTVLAELLSGLLPDAPPKPTENGGKDEGNE